jgi:hypothetical protein
MKPAGRIGKQVAGVDALLPVNCPPSGCTYLCFFLFLIAGAMNMPASAPAIAPATAPMPMPSVIVVVGDDDGAADSLLKCSLNVVVETAPFVELWYRLSIRWHRTQTFITLKG